MSKVLSFLRDTFPDSTFNNKWKEENVLIVFGDLSHICHHAHTLFSDVLQEVAPIKPCPDVTYPKIDWSQVNVRNLANIPKPTACAVHGCSLDPGHYQHQYVPGCVGMDRITAKFETDFPFGHLPGYKTNWGVVAFSENVVLFGHVWSVEDHQWILHASLEDRKPRGQEQRHRRGRQGERSKAALLPSNQNFVLF